MPRLKYDLDGLGWWPVQDIQHVHYSVSFAVTYQIQAEDAFLTKEPHTYLVYSKSFYHAFRLYEFS